MPYSQTTEEAACVMQMDQRRLVKCQSGNEEESRRRTASSPETTILDISHLPFLRLLFMLFFCLNDSKFVFKEVQMNSFDLSRKVRINLTCLRYASMKEDNVLFGLLFCTSLQESRLPLTVWCYHKSVSNRAMEMIMVAPWLHRSMVCP